MTPRAADIVKQLWERCVSYWDSYLLPGQRAL